MSPAIVPVAAWLDRRSTTRILQIVAIVSLIASLFVNVKQRELTSCLASYNDRASAATSARAAANETTNIAIDKVITSIANTSLLPVSQRQPAAAMAFQQYLKSRAAADEQRKLNPIPAPPSETCR